jgi:hypothetical protein
MNANLKIALLTPASTTAADILELGGGSRVFINKGVFVGGSRCVGFNRRRLVLFRSHRIVTSQSLGSILNRAAVWASGNSTLRGCAKRQHDDNLFHSNSSAGHMAQRLGEMNFCAKVF